jgi:RNA methyltransferase, TrmH family
MMTDARSGHVSAHGHTLVFEGRRWDISPWFSHAYLSPNQIAMSLTKNKLKELKELTHKKHRDEQGKFLIEGVRLVGEALNSDYKVLEAFHTADLNQQPGGEALLHLLQKKASAVQEITHRELEALTDTVNAQGVVVVVKQKKFNTEDLLQKNGAQSVLVGFDGVSDPGNVGTMVRTCDWFGVDGILLGRNSVELYNPKVLRSTMGGLFHLPIAEDLDLLSTATHARSLGYKVYVADHNGETHFDHVQYAMKSLLIFGNEAWGVSDQLKALADTRISIRRYGAGESLNVSVACGVVLSRLHNLFDE